MAGILKVDTIQNANADNIITQTNSTTLTIGASGDTVTLAAGATSSGFGRTGTVNWDTTPKTTTVTAVSGTGYFVDTTTTTLTVSLPAGVAGDIVAISDYANTAATNNIIIDPNGTDKINGTNENAKITTNGASVTLIYVDSTRGWKDVNDATLDVTGLPPFVAATGGTITTCGDFKIHSFTGPGTFTVTSAGSPTGSNSVEYLVVAGGGGGGSSTVASSGGGGGGAGGFRQNYPSPATSGLPVTATSYPITVGAGGAGGTTPSSPNTKGVSGSNSIFSTITSTGGGGGGGSCAGIFPGTPGGSGGGAGASGGNLVPGGTGNSPPVSPPQGNNGGSTNICAPNYGSGGGGGAGAVGNVGSPTTGGAGGAGTANSISGSSVTRAGGGGGSTYRGGTPGVGGSGGGGAGGSPPVSGAVAGTANTGGGGGGMTESPAAAGGSGIVIIRYKFQ